jgi:hypothetical protein
VFYAPATALLKFSLEEHAGTSSLKPGLFRQSGGKPMTNLKTLATVAMLSAATASPVFAAGQEGGGPIGPGSSNGLTPQPGPMFHGFSESLFSPYMGHRDAINSMTRRHRSKATGRAD